MCSICHHLDETISFDWWSKDAKKMPGIIKPVLIKGVVVIAGIEIHIKYRFINEDDIECITDSKQIFTTSSKSLL